MVSSLFMCHIFLEAEGFMTTQNLGNDTYMAYAVNIKIN